MLKRAAAWEKLPVYNFPTHYPAPNPPHLCWQVAAWKKLNAEPEAMAAFKKLNNMP